MKEENKGKEVKEVRKDSLLKYHDQSESQSKPQIERTTYNNHFYLICLLSFMLILAPLHRSWSMDVLRGSVEHTDSLPVLWLWIFRLHMGIVYFYGGIAKLDPDWLSGLATRKLMSEANRGTFLEPLMKYEFTSYIYAWSGMLFDLLIPFLLLWKKTRNLAFVAAIVFHFNNNFVFTIGIFPILALTLTMIYYEAGFPRKLVPRKIKNWISREYRKRLKYQEGTMTSGYVQVHHPVLLIFMGIYFIIQLLVPFRHLAYPGWTTWHEEGHDFAWRMMLRQKTSIGQFMLPTLKPGNSATRTLRTTSILFSLGPWEIPESCFSLHTILISW